MTIYIRGMHGLGDNIMQRPFIRASIAREDTYLGTPWPQLYQDLPKVMVVDPRTTLRTQRKNAARFGAWHNVPFDTHEITVAYGAPGLLRGSIFDDLDRQIPLNKHPFIYDAPSFGASPVKSDKPIAVIRPPTLRAEWNADSRNCPPEYIDAAAQELSRRGYHVVSVADTDGVYETLVNGVKPFAHEHFIHGELRLEKLLALVEHAAVVVAPVGWPLPVCIAYKTPVLIIAGGRGQHNAPWSVTDPRQDLSRVQWLMPDRYCMCDQPDHPCAKTITNLPRKLARALDVLSATPEKRSPAAPLEYPSAA